MTPLLWVKCFGMWMTNYAICWGEITACYFYSDFVSSLHTMLPLFTPNTPIYNYRPPRKCYICHYGLRQKALNRKSPRPPKIVSTRKSSLVTRLLTSCRSYLPFSSQSAHSDPTPTFTGRRSKYEKDHHLKHRFQVQQTQDDTTQNDTDDIFGKRFVPNHSSNDKLHNFCTNMDFIHLHKLASLFFPTSFHDHTTTSINQELQKLCPILYNSDDPHPGIGPSHIFMSQHTDHDIPIVIDSGASKSLSPFRSDFVSFKHQSSTISGIGAQSEICGIGTVCWKVVDQHGLTDVIETQAYYVPPA
jgi:hypothetical protein